MVDSSLARDRCGPKDDGRGGGQGVDKWSRVPLGYVFPNFQADRQIIGPRDLEWPAEIGWCKASRVHQHFCCVNPLPIESLDRLDAVFLEGGKPGATTTTNVNHTFRIQEPDHNRDDDLSRFCRPLLLVVEECVVVGRVRWLFHHRELSPGGIGQSSVQFLPEYLRAGNRVLSPANPNGARSQPQRKASSNPAGAVRSGQRKFNMETQGSVARVVARGMDRLRSVHVDWEAHKNRASAAMPRRGAPSPVGLCWLSQQDVPSDAFKRASGRRCGEP